MSAPSSDFPPPHGVPPVPRLRNGRASVVPFPRSLPAGSRTAPLAVNGPDTFTLLKALKRRWAVAACLGLVAAVAAGAAAWFLLSPRFTVMAQLQVLSQTPTLMPRGPHDRDASPAVQRTQVASIKRRDVLNAALKKDEVKHLRLVREQPEPILWLIDELLVKFPEGSEVIDVSMVGDEPDQIIPLIDGVTSAYLELTVDAEHKNRSEKYASLEKTHLAENEKLIRLRQTLEQRTKAAGVGDPSVAVQLQTELIKAHSEAKKEHKRLKGELARLDNAETEMKERLSKLDDLPILESELLEVTEADAQIREHAARKAVYQNLVDRWSGQVRDDDPFLVSYRDGLNRAHSMLAERTADVRKRIEEKARTRARAAHEAVLAQVQQTRPALQQLERAQSAEVDNFERQVNNLGTSSTELVTLNADIARQDRLVHELGKNLDNLRVERDVPPRVRLYQPAAVQKKDIKRQLLATIAAPVAAFVGVCFCVGWWEYRARRIHSGDEVVQALGLQLVGALPPMVNAKHSALGTTGEPLEHQLIESVDAIRTMLLHEASVSETRVVMVTSATNGEGKTTLAGHLAVSLARAGRRTLLIDCDLRRPSAHQMFEQTLQPGLSEILLNEIELPEAIRPTTAMDNLAILPAGQWDREVLKELAQDGFPNMLQKLRDEYDFIIIDSSPVLAATDSLVIGQHVDAVLLSLMRDVSQIPPVNAAAQRLTALGIRVLGVVINGLNVDIGYCKGYQGPRTAGSQLP